MQSTDKISALAVSTVLILAAAVTPAQVSAPDLTHPSSAYKAPDADGFLQRWLILEPMDANGLTESAVQAAVQKEYFPDQFTAIPREIRGARLAIGSNAASMWWLNGQEVIGIYGDRPTVIDDGVSKRITLRRGPNIVRAAIVNGGGATDFCARFLDAKDKLVKDIAIHLGEVRQ